MQSHSNYSGTVGRNIKGEISQFFQENPGCTIQEALLVGEWSKEDLLSHGPGAARDAGKASVRRVA